MALGLHPEVGRLHKVMVHRPGLEHTRLTPSNAEDLLFDDVLWVAQAKREHDAFCELMRDRGIEVFEAATLLPAAAGKPETKDWVANHVLNERQVGMGASERARSWMAEATDAEVAEFLIGGVTPGAVTGGLGVGGVGRGSQATWCA